MLVVSVGAAAAPTTEDVRTAQQALQSLGYVPGKADGIMGHRTVVAIKKFQQHEGLSVTGELDEQTMRALGFPETPAPQAPTPATDTSSDSSGSGGGGFLFLLIIIGIGATVVLVRRGNANRSAKPVWVQSAPASPARAGTQAARAPANPGASVYVSPAVLPSPRSPSATPEPQESQSSNIDVAPSPAGRRSPRDVPELSPETAKSIADHNRRVAEYVASRSSSAAQTPAVSATPIIQPLPVAAEPARTRLDVERAEYFWISKNQNVTIGSFQVPNGMVYVGTKLRTQSGYGTENCLIDPTLPIATNSPDTAGVAMPYWPSYSSISPQSRLAYLQWLSDRGVVTSCIFSAFFPLR